MQRVDARAPTHTHTHNLSRQCKEYENARELVSATVKAREAIKKEELDGSREKIRGVAKKVKLGAPVAFNMHAMGTSFVRNLKDPLFFESAGRGDRKFWGTAEGPTVVISESLSGLEKPSWLGGKLSTEKTGS
jgi:hypothetical protein